MTRSIHRIRTHSKVRFLSAGVDYLESRQLLSTIVGPMPSAGVLMQPFYQIKSSTTPHATSPPADAFTPAQIAKAYGFDKIQFGAIQGDGTGQTIAIVDAYDAPNMQADLDAFSAQFGLPSTTITKVNQTGGTTLPEVDPTGNWTIETALDVEWVHAMAPGANILLVEANSAFSTDLFAAVGYASAHASVVSMSWGGPEFSDDFSWESYLVHPGVSFVVSSGDYGAPVSYPSSSPNALSVGGTSLFTALDGTYSSESGWEGSGGGPSAYFSQPTYQKGVVTQTSSKRANPDVSYNADPNTGFAVYSTSAPTGSTGPGWLTVGGTSAGAPQWAALIAIANQGRALGNQPLLNATDPQEVQALLYTNSDAFRDITTGGSTGIPTYSARRGYDYVTGLGSPFADEVANVLSGQSVIPPVEHLGISAPSTATAGFSFTVTVTAYTPSFTVDTAFLGTVELTSSDVLAGLPASYTFTAADQGVHTFTVTLKTAGAQYITATDTTTGALAGNSKQILVSPTAPVSLTLTGPGSTATAGYYQTVTVSALDAFGNVATGFTGLIQITSSDPRISLYPSSSYTFKAGDAGTYTFLALFGTAGVQSLKVTSKAGLSASISGISVVPATPTDLAASPISASSISLTWDLSSGATKYIIQRSTDAVNWTQIGMSAPNTAAYTDKELLSGTSYFYRVMAAGGIGSGFSNVAFATTPGVKTVATSTLWSNTYTPAVNSFASGSYEVGVNFTSSVDGTVTGARFYKQAYMGGYTHTGHLWSADGTLLASALFVGETYSGWQQVSFSSPVAITANTTYIISFSTGGGPFGMTTSFFSNGGLSSGPIQALSNASGGGNGVYGIGNGVFPNIGAAGMNFWADVVFAAATPQASVASNSLKVAATTGITTIPPAVTGTTTTTSAAKQNTSAIAGSSYQPIVNQASTPIATGIAIIPPTSTGTAATTATTKTAKQSVVVAGNYPYRQVVNQALALSSARK